MKSPDFQSADVSLTYLSVRSHCDVTISPGRYWILCNWIFPLVLRIISSGPSIYLHRGSGLISRAGYLNSAKIWTFTNNHSLMTGYGPRQENRSDVPMSRTQSLSGAIRFESVPCRRNIVGSRYTGEIGFERDS